VEEPRFCSYHTTITGPMAFSNQNFSLTQKLDSTSDETLRAATEMVGQTHNTLRHHTSRQCALRGSWTTLSREILLSLASSTSQNSVFFWMPGSNGMSLPSLLLESNCLSLRLVMRHVGESNWSGRRLGVCLPNEWPDRGVFELAERSAEPSGPFP
jgi:hypothetical protein